MIYCVPPPSALKLFPLETSPTQAPDGLVEVTFTGQLSLAQVGVALEAARERMNAISGRASLVFDCATMTGYDRQARQAFVDWHRAMSKRIHRIAIITVNPLWDLVIAAMALATATRMQSFPNKAAALSWLCEASRE